jgi:hypothetical protein
MAETTENDTNKTIKVLGLRDTKLNGKGLSASTDFKIWGQAIKKQT